MIDLQTAKEKVIKHANDGWGKNYQIEFVFDEDNGVIEKDTLWFIPFTEKKEEDRQAWAGAYKGCIVDKRTGELSQPGSAYDLDTWIWGFELGFRSKRLDLVITNINDEEHSLEILEKFGLQYVKPELENGTIWAVPELFSQAQLKERISLLPCTFENQGLTIMLNVVKELVASNAFDFEVKPTTYDYGNIWGELIDDHYLIKLRT